MAKQARSYSEFIELPIDEQIEFVESKCTDIVILRDLQRERRYYRKVVEKLTDQIISLGYEPCTDILSEDQPNKRKSKKETI